MAFCKEDIKLVAETHKKLLPFGKLLTEIFQKSIFPPRFGNARIINRLDPENYENLWGLFVL